MNFTELPLEGAYLINLDKVSDNRGFFARYWCKDKFEELGLDTNTVQINNSMSMEKGTLRGLHYQKAPKSETKIIRCIHGAVWDVIVDIRIKSPTYGGWYGTELNAENRTMMYVPKGFAHGFISLTKDSEIIYLVTEFYSSDCECSLRWDDPFHKIKWPIEPNVMSEKDMKIDNWSDAKALNFF